MSGLKYKQLRNRAVSELRKAKQQYINNLSKAPNTKQFWSAIKSLNGSCASRVPTLSCNTDSETITDDKQKAKVLNEFFHSCFNTALPPLTQEDFSNTFDNIYLTKTLRSLKIGYRSGPALLLTVDSGNKLLPSVFDAF